MKKIFLLIAIFISSVFAEVDGHLDIVKKGMVLPKVGVSIASDSSKIQYFVTKPKDKEGKIIETSNELEITVDKDNYKIFNNKPKKFRLKVFPNNKSK